MHTVIVSAEPMVAMAAKAEGTRKRRLVRFISGFRGELDSTSVVGAPWFASGKSGHCLIDYCPAANWGNWAYAAGVGADPRGFRGFDIAKQARRYDADGAYVAHWLPELEAFPGPKRHAPWLVGGPAPIVDPARSLDAARRRWESAEGFGRQSF